LQRSNDNINLLKCEKGAKTLHTIKRNKDNTTREMQNEDDENTKKKNNKPK
jgi:hypothetical protein